MQFWHGAPADGARCRRKNNNNNTPQQKKKAKKKKPYSLTYSHFDAPAS